MWPARFRNPRGTRPNPSKIPAYFPQRQQNGGRIFTLPYNAFVDQFMQATSQNHRLHCVYLAIRNRVKATFSAFSPTVLWGFLTTRFKQTLAGRG